MQDLNQPSQYNFRPHYRGNGLLPFILQLRHIDEDRTPVNLTFEITGLKQWVVKEG